MKHERKIIAVDLDKTLTNGGRWWKKEEIQPNEKIVNWINEQFIKGSVIIIHTARPWEISRETISWLVANNIKYHGVNFNKMSADLYIDDKAINVKDLK